MNIAGTVRALSSAIPGGVQTPLLKRRRAKMANRIDDPIGYEVEDWRARASLARSEARTLITRAEIWEDAAGRLEDAIDAAAKKRPVANPGTEHTR